MRGKLPPLLAVAVGVFTGIYTFQPLLAEQARGRNTSELGEGKGMNDPADGRPKQNLEEDGTRKAQALVEPAEDGK
ncbi:hypothetical protein BDZ91DRAFT_801484 [Kalaharituber pfeilii]|nr:hypothetical protein BDZ91DRAFT_801484 [Kalaharituber pfeilii]